MLCISSLGCWLHLMWSKHCIWSMKEARPRCAANWMRFRLALQVVHRVHLYVAKQVAQSCKAFLMPAFQRSVKRLHLPVCDYRKVDAYRFAYIQLSLKERERERDKKDRENVSVNPNIATGSRTQRQTQRSRSGDHRLWEIISVLVPSSKARSY